jgi:non-heme chloroperoxidase
MREHRISGGGGLELHVTDQGAESAPAIVFIHGWAQSHICWHEQVALAENYRLIALDLRGHGASGAPADIDAYTDTALWAADLNAVITDLKLDHPILVGWSYGSRVIASYLATYGDSGISGIVLAGGILAIGTAREDWMVGPGSPGLNRDLYTDDDAKRATATAHFITNCTVEPLAADFTDALFGANMQVTPLVRRALFASDWDFRPVFANFNKPALVIHGVEDEVVLPATGIAAFELLPMGELELYEYAGHAPFLEQPARFNTDLSAFATTAFGAAA